MRHYHDRIHQGEDGLWPFLPGFPLAVRHARLPISWTTRKNQAFQSVRRQQWSGPDAMRRASWQPPFCQKTAPEREKPVHQNGTAGDQLSGRMSQPLERAWTFGGDFLIPQLCLLSPPNRKSLLPKHRIGPGTEFPEESQTQIHQSLSSLAHASK